MKRIQALMMGALLMAAGVVTDARAASTGYAFCYFANTAMRSMGSIGVSTTSSVAVGAANSSCTSCHYDGSFTAYFRAEVKSGYRFKGWSTNATYFWSYSTDLSCSKFVGSGNSVSLYAWFEEDAPEEPEEPETPEEPEEPETPEEPEQPDTPDNPDNPEEPEEPEGPQTYGITYLDMFGMPFTGTPAEGTPDTHTCGTATTLLTPQKEGCEFEGWYLSDDCFGTPVTEVAADLCEEVTLYAKWTVPILPEEPEEPQTYGITYLDMFGMPFTGTPAEGTPGTHTCGTATTLLQPQKEGCEFEGWYLSDDCFGTPVTEVAADLCEEVTLYAKWTVPILPEEPEETVVRLDFNNGTGNGQTVIAVLDEAMPALTEGGEQLLVPMMVGFEFGGYYDTDATTGGTQYYTPDMSGARTWDKDVETFTLYARWIENSTPENPDTPVQPEEPDDGPIVLEDNHQAGDEYYDMLAGKVGRIVESVTYKRTFAANTWSVFSVPFDYSFLVQGNTTFSGDVYELASADYSQTEQCMMFYFLPVTTGIRANRPYIYYSETGVRNPVFASVTIAAVADNSYLADGGMVEFRNSTVYEAISPDPKVVLLNNNRLYMLGSTTYMRAFRGYFYLQQALSVAPRARIVLGGRTATEIEVTEFPDGSDESARKYVENGVMVIERNGVRYGTDGRRLQNASVR